MSHNTPKVVRESAIRKFQNIQYYLELYKLSPLPYSKKYEMITNDLNSSRLTKMTHDIKPDCRSIIKNNDLR